MMPVRLEPAAIWSRVKHSTTEPLRSPNKYMGGCFCHFSIRCSRQVWYLIVSITDLCLIPIFTIKKSYCLKRMITTKYPIVLTAVKTLSSISKYLDALLSIGIILFEQIIKVKTEAMIRN